MDQDEDAQDPPWKEDDARRLGARRKDHLGAEARVRNKGFKGWRLEGSRGLLEGIRRGAACRQGGALALRPQLLGPTHARDEEVEVLRGDRHLSALLRLPVQACRAAHRQPECAIRRGRRDRPREHDLGPAVATGAVVLCARCRRRLCRCSKVRNWRAYPKQASMRGRWRHRLSKRARLL